MSCKTCGSLKKNKGKKNGKKSKSCKMGPGKLIGSKSKCLLDGVEIKCDANKCQKIDLKKPSKRNVKDPEIRKTNFVTGDRFPSCPPTDKDTFFYHTKKNMIFTYDRKTKEWVTAHCGKITVETGTTETGPTTSGPFTLDTCGDTLRLWSAGGLFANVTPGSALVQMEPNIIHCGNDPEDFMPADPTRPALYFNSNTGMFFVWDPENSEGMYNHWHASSGGGEGGGGVGEELEVLKIHPKEFNQALAVVNPLNVNVSGFTKFFLSEDLFFIDFEESGGMLPTDEFETYYSTLSSDYVLNEAAHYTLPPVSYFNNPCLNSGVFQYLLEINIKLNYKVDFFDYDDYLVLAVVKGEETISQTTEQPLTHYIGSVRTLSLNDTVLVDPGDNLSINLFKFDGSDSDGKVELLGGSENCVFTFKILSLQPVI